MRGLSCSKGRDWWFQSRCGASAHCLPFQLNFLPHGRPLHLRQELLSTGLHLGFLGWLLLLANWLPFLLPLVRLLLLAALIGVPGLLVVIKPGDFGLPRGAAQVPGVVLASTVGAACSRFLLLLVLKKAVLGVMGASANPAPGRGHAALLAVAPPLTPVAPQWLRNKGSDSKVPPRAGVNEFKDFSLKEHRDLLGLHSCPGLHPNGPADVQPGKETETKLLGEAIYYNLLQ